MGRISQEGPEATDMRIARTVQEAVAAMTAQGPQDEEMMSINHMEGTHVQVMVIAPPMLTTVIVTVHDPVLQKAETSHQRNGIRTKSSNRPPIKP